MQYKPFYQTHNNIVPLQPNPTTNPLKDQKGIRYLICLYYRSYYIKIYT